MKVARHARAPSSFTRSVSGSEIRTGPVLRGAGGVAATIVLGVGLVGASIGIVGVSLAGTSGRVGLSALPGAGAGAGAGAAAAAPAVDRAAAVPDVPWLTERGDGRWVYGRGSGTTPRVLPARESGLAIDETYVATTVPNASGQSTVRVRDRETGRKVADVDAPIWISAGAWASGGLVVTGYPDSAMGADGGLVLLALPDFAAQVLVEPRPFPAKLGTPVARGDVVVSPSGAFVGSNVCGVHLCDTQVVELATGRVFRPIQSEEGFLRALTDEVVVTTDDDSAWIAALRFRDGREAWRVRDSALLDPMAAADGSVAGVVGSRATGWGVASFDVRGRQRDLTPRAGGGEPWPRIWRELSTSTTAVVGQESFGEAVGGPGNRPVVVLGLTGADPDRRASTFGLPVEAEWIDR
jgi:hypothetical protein